MTNNRSSNRFRRPAGMLLLILLVTLTGCWDSRKIEEVSFVTGIAMDAGTKNLIDTTFQIVLPKIAAGENNQGKKPYMNIVVKGNHVHEMLRDLSLQTNPIKGSHVKVVVIGEKLARTVDLKNLFEFLFRDEGVRESLIIVVAKGKAIDTLDAGKAGQIPADRLTGVADNQYKSIRLVPQTTLQKLMSKLTSDSSFILQSVIASKGDLRFSGAAIIKGKNDKLAGFLNEEDVKGLVWLLGEHTGGVLAIFKNKQPFISYEVRSTKSEITPKINGDRISFDVRLETTGRISEDWRPKSNNFEDESLKQAEEAVKKEIDRLIERVLNKMQKKFHADVAGFGTTVKIHHPKLWKRVKENWDEEFSRADIKYNVKVDILEYQLRGMRK